MLILTEENKPYSLDRIPDSIEEDIRYCVLDCSDAKNIDYYWLPLIFLESFSSPAVVLEIGKYKIQMPLDWSILVTDEHTADLEVMPLTRLNDRGFYTMTFNPLKQTWPAAYEINITDVYADVKWYFPKLKNGNVLVMPLEDKPEPACALFVKEGTKVPDPIDVALIFE